MLKVILFNIPIAIIIYLRHKIRCLQIELNEKKENDHQETLKNYCNLQDKMKLEKKCSALEKELEFYKYLNKKNDESIIEKNKIIKPIFKNKRVLVGDYNLEMLNHTRKVLKSLGFEVDTVQTGMDMVNMALINNNYDVIITNNLYKDSYDGQEVMMELREIKKFKTPIVVLTVSTGEEERFLKLGFDGYLEKALITEQAIKVLKKVIKNK